MDRYIIVKAFKKNDENYPNNGKTFLFSLVGRPVSIGLPDGAPFEGYRIHLSTDGHDGYEFTPDAAETFVRFGVGRVGRLEEYFGVDPYLLLFTAVEGSLTAVKQCDDNLLP